MNPQWMKFSRTCVRTVILCAAIISFLYSESFATPIDEKYSALGGMSGFLGAPNGEETNAPDRADKPLTGNGGIQRRLRRVVIRGARLGWCPPA